MSVSPIERKHIMQTLDLTEQLNEWNLHKAKASLTYSSLYLNNQKANETEILHDDLSYAVELHLEWDFKNSNFEGSKSLSLCMVLIRFFLSE